MYILLDILMWMLCAILVLIALCGIVGLLKNRNTFKNHSKISNAIYAYIDHESDRAYKEAVCDKKDFYECYKPKVYFDDMEDYNVTYQRWWDWGYTRILPPDKFEIIKPFLDGNYNNTKSQPESYSFNNEVEDI